MQDYRYNIMLVEDEPEILELYSTLLEFVDYKVHKFTGAIDALNFLKDTDIHIDLIISDVNMPEISGIEFLHRLKATPEYSSIPFLFLSKLKDEKVHLNAFSGGAVDFLIKTGKKDIFLYKVKSLLQSISISSLKNNIVLKGNEKDLKIEDIISYCEDENLAGYAYIYHLNKNAVIIFERGVLANLRHGSYDETEAFERINQWNKYKFCICRGKYNPGVIRQYINSQN